MTVTKNLTIDGGDKTYTGTMTIANGKTVTVQNVNFVKGCIDKAKGTSGTLTVKNCDFDGVDKSINYAITMRGGNTVTVEGVTVKNYDYGFLYVPSAVTNVNVKGANVDSVNYGVHVAYGSKVNVEDVTMTNVAYGIMTQNYGAKTITLTNSSISGTNPIYIWERNTTVVDTYKFVGANTLVGADTWTQSAQASFVLIGADSTLTAPAGLTVTTDVADSVVVYENGVYSVKELPDVAQINGMGYKSIQAAIDAAVDGDTITIVADHALSSTPVIESTYGYTTLVLIEGKSVTIDFAGHTVTAVTGSADLYTAGIADTLISVIFAGKGASLTLKDSVGNGGIYVKHNADGGKVYSMIYNCASNLVIENGTYTVEETITTGSLIYADSTYHTTAVKGGQFTLGNASADASSTKPWIINTEGKNNSFVEVTGGIFNQDILMNYGTKKDCEVKIPRTLALKNNDGVTWTIVDAAAYVGDGEYNNGYATLVEAIAAGNKVTLVADNAEDVELTKSITLDLGGKSYTGTVTLTALDVTLAAAEGLDVVTNVGEDYKVAYVDGVYKVVEKVYVAQVGTAKFESIQDAVNAAQDGDTITVIADHEIACDVDPLITISGKAVTIDLNGYEVTTNAASAENVVRIVFNTASDGKLTVKDSIGTGAVTANGEGVLYYMFRNQGEMTIQSGSFTLSAYNGGAMFFSTNSNMLVEGGNFAQTTTGWMFNTSGNGSEVITVTGGTFNRYFIGGAAYGENEWNEVKVPYVYALADNNDGTWTIVDATCYNATTETGYVTLADAIAEAESGETIVLLADFDEDVTITGKSITLELNRFYMDGQITLASTDAALTSGKDLNVIAKIDDADDVKVIYTAIDSRTGTYTVAAKKYVAQNGETKYEDLSDALAAAGTGETVQVIAENVSEDLIMVPAGVTLDLNGYVVTAENILSFGIVMDSATEVGGIKISNNTAEAFVKLQSTNGGYLPIYDTRDGQYKFFKYATKVLGTKENGDMLTFGFRITFENAQAYHILVNTADRSFDVICDVTWDGMREGTSFRVKYSDTKIVDYANGWISKPNGTWAFKVDIGGLNALNDGAKVYATPMVSSDTDANFELEQMEYVKDTE